MFPEGVHSLSHSSFLREKFPDLTVMLWQLQASDLIGQKQVQEGSCQPAVPLIYLEYFPSDFCIDSLEVMKQHILTTNMSTVIGSSPSLFRVFSSWNKKKGKTKIYHLEKESRFHHRAFPYFMSQWWLFILDEAKDSNTADVTTCSSTFCLRDIVSHKKVGLKGDRV